LESALREVKVRSGGTLLIGWGPAEEKEAEALADALGDAHLIPPTTIRELTYLLARCDLFIGMDTGPMHLAGLVGTPVVAVFGRSSAAVHGPAEHLPGVAVAGAEARHWPRRTRTGLKPFTDPEPAAVIDAALEVLASRRGG
jgi:ADP-heptose:LPS heptosyltransferase